MLNCNGTLCPSSQTFWVVVRSLLSSSYEFFHRRLLPRFMPGKKTSVTFIDLLLCFFHFQISWSRSFDDKRTFFYSFFIICINFVVCFCEIYSWSFFENQFDWFIADKRCGSFGMVLWTTTTQWLFYRWQFFSTHKFSWRKDEEYRKDFAKAAAHSYSRLSF